VRADGEPAAGYAEVDPETRLLRLARPILDRLEENMVEAGVAVILTDSAGRVLDRRAPRFLRRTLDRTLLAPGYLYSEASVGTNGIGTATEDPNSGWVVGSEHYVEWLQGLSCAGAPIRNPMTGDIEGVLDLTCRFTDTDPLLVPFVKEAARDVERQLYEDLVQQDRELFFLLTAAAEQFWQPGSARDALIARAVTARLPEISDPALLSQYVAKVIQRVEDRARLLERQRLSRELHDSVSQALYGITLGVEAASDLAGRAPERINEPLGYVRQLAQAGMAEMRAIILGLRSESLQNDGLVGGLTKQAQALEARHELIVDRDLQAEPAVSLDVKEELLRISQEAMHNVAKHSRAKRVRLRLAIDELNLQLEIVDDGIGFDSGGSFPGHFGLISMQERIHRFGGRLEVTSAVGQGTRICAQIPLESSAKLLIAPA
jgi:signal transduction histidine kinase